MLLFTNVTNNNDASEWCYSPDVEDDKYPHREDEEDEGGQLVDGIILQKEKIM